jgi:phenylacetate-CoA ligase
LSTLDARAPLPLLRYQTGDRARILDHTEVATAYAEVGRAPQSLPALPLIALAGREQDLLPDGRAILDLKDALYLDPELAAGLTGAFRCEQTQGEGCHIQVQLRADAPVDPYWQGRLADLLPQPQDGLVDRVTLWPYGAFPFGMGLDYERKFHYQAAEARPERRG